MTKTKLPDDEEMLRIINEEMATFEPDEGELAKLKIVATKLIAPLMKALTEDYLILNLFSPKAGDEGNLSYALRLYAKAIRALSKVLDICANEIEKTYIRKD